MLQTSQPNNSAAIHAAAMRLATTAKQAGVPREVMERFMRYGYVPQPMQLRFHAAARMCDETDGPTQIGIGGARGPGKSHAVFAQIALDDCQRIPNLKVLYLRKIARNAREQLDDLRRSVLRTLPHDYNRTGGVLTFKNDSRLLLGHFNNESDIDQYLGLEYDVIAIEEATSLTASKYKSLRDSNRTAKPGFRPRIYSSTNPGGVGHAWYRDRFIKPYQQGVETDTRFIPGTVTDNVFIDPDYQRKLEENTGWKLRAYRYGDWDIAAGQFFSTWNYEAHVIEPYDVSHLEAWGGFDYGFTHPTVCYPMVMDDGCLIIAGEHYGRKQLPEAHALGIKQLGERLKLKPEWLRRIYAGPDVFANKGDEQAKTIAAQYKTHGIILHPAITDRISGASEILKRLGEVNPEGDKEPILPTIKIFNTCTRLIECLPSLQHDPHRPEDVLKVDASEDGFDGDDFYDAARYGAMSRVREWKMY